MNDIKDLITRDVRGMSVKEIRDLITDESTVGIVKPINVRIRIIKLIYQLLGYDLNKELLYMLASEPRAMLVEATAGSGKTTSSHMKLVAEKIYRTSVVTGKPITGDRMLCLVYNAQNVNDMKNRHKELVSKLYASGLQDLDIDNQVHAATMHSFCREWAVLEYTNKAGFVGATLLEEHESISLMKSVLDVMAMKHKRNMEFVQPKDLLSLYTYAKESLMNADELSKVDKFLECGLPFEIVEDCFKAYDGLKKMRNKYDYTDMLTRFYDLLKNDEEVRSRLQEYYEYVVVDEVQDFTNIMHEIVKLVVGPNTPLLCIGDGDQCIYNFKGADIANILDFKNRYEGAEVCTLGINRRCGKKIVEAAKTIVEENKLRFIKTITAKREGGEVLLKPYTSKQGQLINVIKDLTAIGTDDLSNTVVCYRNRKSSMAIACMLEERGIPFHLLSGYGCFDHELIKHVRDVLELLYLESDQQAMINLYKCLPIRKSQIYNFINYDPRKKEFKPFSKTTPFYALNFGELSRSDSFMHVIQKLKSLVPRVETETLDQYFPEVFNLICKFFWNYKMSLNKEDDLDQFFTKQVFDMFNKPIKYQNFRRDLGTRMDIVRLNQKVQKGVALATFHTLKGLEYKNVIIIDCNNDLFPNFASIEDKDYPDDVKLNLKECETRLMYVAMTRAKDRLIIYYDDTNPSIYIDDIAEFLNDWKDVNELGDMKAVSNHNLPPINTFSKKNYNSVLSRFT